MVSRVDLFLGKTLKSTVVMREMAPPPGTTFNAQLLHKQWGATVEKDGFRKISSRMGVRTLLVAEQSKAL